MPLTEEERWERGRESDRRYYKNNREKVRERQRRWHENNLEKGREQSQRWRENNPEKAREVNQRYRIENPLRKLFQDMRSRSKERGHPFDLTFEEFQQHYINHVDTYGHCCAITGVEFVNETKHPHRCSVDRIDSEIGYTLDNIIFVTKEFNVEKKNLSPTNTLKLANFLIERGFSL